MIEETIPGLSDSVGQVVDNITDTVIPGITKDFNSAVDWVKDFKSEYDSRTNSYSREGSEGSEYNNPANLEKTSIKWDGETGKTYSNGRFTTFDTPEAGIAAMTKDLTTKLKDFNGDLKSMINKYAPELTQKELKNYMQVVQKTAGKKYKYTMDDIDNIVKGFIRMENKKELADYYINIMEK